MRLSLSQLTQRLLASGRQYLRVEALGLSVVHVPTGGPIAGKFPAVSFLFRDGLLVDVEVGLV